LSCSFKFQDSTVKLEKYKGEVNVIVKDKKGKAKRGKVTIDNLELGTWNGLNQ